MNLSINPAHFTKAPIFEQERSLLEAVTLVKNTGFKHFDLGLDDVAEAERTAEYLKTNGLTVIQSHIPFNRYIKDDREVFYNKVMARAKASAVLGTKIFVVHGDEFDFGSMTYSRQAVLEYNYGLFYDLVEFSAQNGIRVAFENVFQDGDAKASPRFCSFVDDLCELVDKFGTETVGICWDTGHGRVQYKDKHTEALKTAGSRVICTHVHDNFHASDMHLFPFLGNTDWQKLMQTFREIGYNGDLSFELVYDRIPSELLPDHLKLLYKTGEYLIKL